MTVIVGVIALVAALTCSARWGGDGDEQEPAEPTATPQRDRHAGRRTGTKEREPARRTRVRLQIQPTGPVSVCLEDGSGEPLIANLTLEAGENSETFSAKRFRVSFGTGAAVMRVDGKKYPVSDDAPVGYEVRAGGKPRALADAKRPNCSG